MSIPSPANPAKHAILAIVLAAVLMSVLDPRRRRRGRCRVGVSLTRYFFCAAARS